MKVRRISDWRLREELNRARGLMAVMFLMSGRGRDLGARKEFRKLAGTYSTVPFFEIDLAEHPSLAEQYPIEETPTTILFFDGAERVRHVGRWLADFFHRFLGPEPVEEDNGTDRESE